MEWKDDLRRIGDLLDADHGPDVLQGGSVTPDPSHTPSDGSGLDKEFGLDTKQQGQGSDRPAAGPWEGSASAAPVASDEVHEVLGDPRVAGDARKDVAVASKWRPQMGLLLAPPVLWIHYWFRPLEHSSRKAFHLVAYPLPGSSLKRPQGWAWWDLGVRIGPRHLNWGDGGICAYEYASEWAPGDPLIELLDLYSVWTARHLYLLTFDRWPGTQVMHTPYERLVDHQRGELCGCGSAEKKYEDCHLDVDLALSTEEIIQEFRHRPNSRGGFAPTTRLTPPGVLAVRNRIWGITQREPRTPSILRIVFESDPKGRWRL